jgi:predicted PurR-regulated permease PerM
VRNANWTRILTILLSLLALYALIAVLAGIVQRFVTPLLLLVLASLVAFVLTPVVDLIQRTMRIYRWMAILMTYVALGCVMVSLGYFMTTPLVDQTKALTGAIKNPTAQNLTSVIAFKQAAANYASQVHVYQTDVTQTQLDKDGIPLCLPTLAHCASSTVSGIPVYYVPCYAAYFLKAVGPWDNPSAVWVSNNCGAVRPGIQNKIWADWRNGHGLAQPFMTVRPITVFLTRLQADLDRLSKSSIIVGGGQSARRIATVEVPSTYSKPAVTAMKTLTADIAQARTDVFAQTSSSYASDAAQIAKDAQTVASQAHSLYRKLKSSPIIVVAAQNLIDQHHWPINVGTAVSSAITKLRGQGTTVLNNAVSILTGTLNAIFDILVILIMSLYLLADGPRFIRWLMGLVPETHREQAWFLLGRLNRVLGGYIRGQLIVAITIGILAGIGCWIIGVPYALLLGIFAFLAESIPVMGPIIASVPAIAVALFTLPFLQTLMVVGWFVIIQQIEQNVVGPRITGHAVGIHPVVAMVAVIIGLEIGGIWGAFLAVPMAGIIFVLVGEAYSYLVLRKPLPTAEIPNSMDVEQTGAEATGSA